MTSARSTASTAFSRSSAAIMLMSILLPLLPVVRAATYDQWRQASIYQIITDRFARPDGAQDADCDVYANKYCGGSWQGIIDKLDYIQGMGFTAVWISPVVTNIAGNDEVGEPYHGFWSKDITTLNDHFGTPDDLVALSKALHDRNMLFMIDVVANNFAYAGPGGSTVYSDFVPFNDKKYFHDFCYISNYTNQKDYQDCWLGSDTLSLPDMDSDSTDVREGWINWAKDVISKYSIDGFRIDAAKHVEISFWEAFQPEVNLYTVGEVLTGNQTDACRWSNGKGLDAVLNYPMWYTINSTFLNEQESMKSLWNQYTGNFQDCRDTTLLGTFNENQDQPRLANYTADDTLLKNVLAYTILGEGIPIIYYGSEQRFFGVKDPENREPLWTTSYNTDAPLYKLIAAVNAARNTIASVATYDYWSSYWTWKTKMVIWEDEYLVMRKGYDHSVVAVLTNRGQNSGKIGPISVVDTNFNDGEKIMDVVSCDTATTGQYGTFQTTIQDGEPQVWVPTYMMKNNTKICPKVSRVDAVSTSDALRSSAGVSAAVTFLAVVAAYATSLL